MNNKLHTYRKETVRHRRVFSSCLKICLIMLLVLSCKKNSSGPEIDTEDLLPSALILSPPKVTITNSQDAPAAKRNANLQSYNEVESPHEPKTDRDSEETDMEVSGKTTTDLPDANTYMKGTPILFEGIGVNFQGDTLDGASLKWISDIDGELGTGNLLEKTDLTTGRHWISMIVTDHNRLESRDSVRIEIMDAKDLVDEPDGLMAEITSHTNGISLLQHTELILEGTGFDAEDGELTGSSLSWSSNKNGDLGKGGRLDVTGSLSSGDHDIILTAVNSKGETATDSVNISIELDKTNESPVAQIVSLTNGDTLLDDLELILEGTGIDPEDGELTGSALSWKSDLDGELGTGRKLDVTGMLSLGDHLITLTVTDSEGATGNDSVDISIEAEEVINEPPVAEITSLIDGLNVSIIDNLILEGIGTDPEDGELSGSSLSWNSDIDGELGTGNSLDVTGKLSPGDHIITFTATDSKGEKDSDSVQITVSNEPPVAEITSLTDGLTIPILDDLILEGTGFDPEDGELSGTSLSWSSNIDGELGSGSSLDVTGKLSLGDHIITLTATDSEEGTGSDSVGITIYNEPPVADITSPEDGLILSILDELILEGTGTDPEDGELSGTYLFWSSDIDGELGNGKSLNVTGELEPGEHKITLTITDSEGNTDSENVEITILGL